MSDYKKNYELSKFIYLLINTDKNRIQIVIKKNECLDKKCLY